MTKHIWQEKTRDTPIHFNKFDIYWECVGCGSVSGSDIPDDVKVGFVRVGKNIYKVDNDCEEAKRKITMLQMGRWLD